MIAITGASGFIGSYISGKLMLPQKKLSRFQNHEISKNSNHKWVHGDLENEEDITSFVQNSPTLIHLGCSTHPRSSNLNMKQDVSLNLISTIRLFETFAKVNPGGHIIYASSGGNMYDATQNHALHTEEDVPHPQSSYGIHKLAAEHYLRLICEKYSIKGTILRISNPYGVLLPKQRAQGLIGVCFSKLISNESLSILDSLESVRDYVHLDDVTEAFKLTIQAPPALHDCQLFNLSSGVGYSLEKVLQLIESVTGRQFIKHFPSTTLPCPTWSVLSNQKINHVLGWVPKISLEQGIKNMCSNSNLQP